MSDYDEVYLVPKSVSTIRSRDDVDLKSDFLGLYPIISSPMKGVSGSSLVIEMGKNNCLGVLHRFDTMDKRKENVEKISDADVPFGVAIGLKDFDKELDFLFYAANSGCVFAILDQANAYIPQIAEAGKKLKEVFKNRLVLATGNVVNYVGAEYVMKSGFDMVRCGIGNGSVCTTKDVTGVSRNMLATLKDCDKLEIELIADGGIKKPGDAVKAFAFGAHYVMLGSVLAMADEVENTDGVYYGMASAKNHILNDKEIKSIEGREVQLDVTKKRPLRDILNEFLYGIRSSCTYLNCKNYSDLYYNAQPIPVKEKLC